jgi:hypothetical protein
VTSCQRRRQGRGQERRQVQGQRQGQRRGQRQRQRQRQGPSKRATLNASWRGCLHSGPKGPSVDMTWVETRRGSLEMTWVETRLGRGRPRSPGTGLGSRPRTPDTDQTAADVEPSPRPPAGSHLRSLAITAGRMPAAPWDAPGWDSAGPGLTPITLGGVGFQPAQGQSPSGRRHHSGQDARCTREPSGRGGQAATRNQTSGSSSVAGGASAGAASPTPRLMDGVGGF